MNTDWEDTKLRQLSSEQRQREEQRAPAFASVLAKPPATEGAGLPWWRLAPLAAATVVLLALGVAQFMVRPRPESVPVTVEISEWDAPTDFLLDESLLVWNTSSSVPGPNE